MARFMPGKYPDLSTNAEFLNVGQPLTRKQIDVLAEIEHDYVEGRGHVKQANVETLLHEFMCKAMLECVCMEKRDLDLDHPTAAEVMEQEG